MTAIPQKIFSFIVFLILIGLGVSFENGLQYNREEDARSQTIKATALVRSRIEHTFNDRLRFIETVKAISMAKPNIDQREMERLAGWVLEGRPEVRALSLAPKAVVRMFVPLAGNEAAVGHDLLADPARREAVQAAIDNRQIMTQGPVKLKQGGTGVMARDPVFIRKADGSGDEFWGLAVIVLDFDALYKRSIPAEIEQTYAIALRHIGKDGKPGATFVGKEDIFASAIAKAEIALPGARWEVALAPIAGWPPASPTRLIVYFGAALLGLLLALLIHRTLVELQRRRKAEAELRTAIQDVKAREARLTSVLETIAEGIVIVDEDDVIIAANTACKGLFGVSRRDLIGSRLRDRLLLDASIRYDDLGNAGINVAARRGDTEMFVSGILIGKIDADSSWTGRPLHTIVVRDISERVQQEQERLRMMERLSESNKFESLGTLAGGIAHEINTPTQFVSDNLRFLEEGIETLLDIAQHAAPLAQMPGAESFAQKLALADIDFLKNELPAATAQALDGMRRIGEIVRAIKEFSYPSSKTPAPFDLNHAIESTATVTKNQWKYVAEMELDLAPDLPLVTAVEGEINQVLLNVIVNAAQAIAEKKSDAPGRIVITTRKADENVEIRISDTGPGMSDEVRQKIFEMFFTTKPPGQGTGQGLAITHAIIHRHGGRIDVKSEPGAGAIFTILLPIEGLRTAANDSDEQGFSELLAGEALS